MRSRNLPVLAVANPAPNTLAPIEESVIPQELATPGLSMLQIYSIVRAYRIQALIIALLVSVSAAVLIKIMPKTYSATATLMVSPLGNDPLARNQEMATPLFNYMSTEAQLMQSPEVLLPVIDQLHLIDDKDYTAGYHGGGTMRDWISENLVKDLNIELGAFGSELIYVNASARTAQLAAQIANTLTDVYLTEQRQRISGPASERAKRYALELAELKDKVRVAQDQVTEFRQRSGVTDTTERNSAIEKALLGNLEGKLQDAQNARRTAEVRAMGSSADNPREATASLAVVNLKSVLNAQQAQLAQLLTSLGPKHPKVLELQSQIESTQRNLDKELGDFNSNASSELAAARQLEAKMRAAVEEQRNKTLNVNKLQDEGTKYELELDAAQAIYKRALDDYDQIMFASDGRLPNISVVSSAIPPQKPTKPNKIKLMMMGMFAGIGLGLLGPLAYELLINRRVRCRDDFERNFDIPVLIEFDRIVAVRRTA